MPQETDSNAVKISATIGALQTRVSYEDSGATEFQLNDRIRVISYTRQGKSKNDAVYKFNGPLDWEPVLFDKYVVWEGITDNTFYGVYPSDAEYDTFTIPTDQSGGVQVADWMTAEFKGNKSVGRVNFIFQHRLAKVTVNITKWNNEFTGTEDITEPKIYTKGTAVEVSYGTGTYGADEYTSDDTHTAITASATDLTYTAIVAPVKYGLNDTFMTFKVAGKDMTVLATASQLTNGLESGNHYTFNLTVGKNAVTIESVSVKGWDEQNIDGGVATEITHKYDPTTNTYTVYTAEGLYVWGDAARADCSANLVLAADITLTGENNWTPVCTAWEPYTGTVDGDGHTIIGLRINSSDSDQGFISALEGTVKNLTFADAVVSGGYSSGIVAGTSDGGTIENCHVISGSLTSTKENVGGIVGNNVGTVINCTNAAAVTASGGRIVGGIAGINGNSLVESLLIGCINTGTISGDSFVGGVSGDNENGIIIACGNRGTVTCTFNAGGIAGKNEKNSTVISSWTFDTYEYGTSEVEDSKKNGIGNDESNDTISSCYSGDSTFIYIQVDGMNDAIRIYNESAAEGKTCPYTWWVESISSYPTLVKSN